MNGGLMDVAAAAEYLAVRKTTVYKLVGEGRLTAVVFGTGKTGRGNTRFRVQDLDAFIEEHVTGDGTPPTLGTQWGKRTKKKGSRGAPESS